MTHSSKWLQTDLNHLVCPNTRRALSLALGSGGEQLLVGGSRDYKIVSDIAMFLDRKEVTAAQSATVESYARIISYYDNAIEWLFASTFTSESELREKMVDELQISASSRVIDVGAGTARDSVKILRRLGPDGLLYVHDISVEMLRTAQVRLSNCGHDAPYRLIQGPAGRLPFEDGALDALYSFGGLNEFGDCSAVLEEFSRVVRVGGRIVVGDEGVAPWLVGTEHHRILAANNPIFFSNPIPIQNLPKNAHDVSLRWVLGNAFYLMSFTVGADLPPLDLDLEHEGRRGGSLRTRYFGALDGVDPSLRRRAEAAAMKDGVSFMSWLEDCLLTRINDQDSGPE